MQRGYIKLWRKSLDSDWLLNHILWCFWCWCLLKATHKPKDVLVGFQKVHLEPGQFVFGIHKAGRAIGASPRQIRTCRDTLVNMENLTIKSTSKFSIVSIINWESYQQTEFINDNQSDKQPTSKRQATDNKQECKEHKNVKNKERESVALPDWIDQETWSAFKEFRIRIKAPLTNRATKNIITELEKLKSSGNDPNAVIDQSITRGWRGVFELRKDGFKPKDTTGSETPPDRANKILQKMQERERMLRGEN